MVYEANKTDVLTPTEGKALGSKLESFEREFHSLAENQTLNIARWDTEGRYLYINPAHEHTLGKSASDVIGTIIPDSRKVLKAKIAEAVATGEPTLMVELSVPYKDGSNHRHDVILVPERSNDGKIVSVLGIGRDMTDFYQALDTAAARGQEFHNLAEGSPDFILRYDRDGRIVYLNTALLRELGLATAEQVIGKRPCEMWPDGRFAQIERTAAQVVESGTETILEFCRAGADGEPRYREIRVLPERDIAGRIIGTIAYSRNITERKLAEEKMHRLAFYDPLTGLPNRQLLCDRVGHALVTRSRHRRNGAVLFVDIDHFQRINDILGRESGDLLLQQVSQRLNSSLREGDTVARVGGDQFVILLEGLSEDLVLAKNQTESIAGKIAARLHEDYLLAGALAQCTVSIGVAMFDSELETEELLSRAQLAMNEVKSAEGQHICFFDPQMHALVIAQASMEADLRQALLKDQFLLYYQVQVDSSGRPVGAEALLRWNHPKRGFVSPAEFIPMAENNGLILPIGKWVLETACRQLAAWASQPRMATFTLAVNVSARQFHHGNFVTQVLDVLEITKANPHRLKLELTEGLLLNDVEGVIAKMTVLKGHGISFSLDDFGTGYSSLSYLKRLPLDQLKIDQSFVRDVLSNPDDAPIARTIIALGQSLELNIIAEGVETGEQREFLASNGCLNYQGYLFSRPLRLEEFDQFVQRV